MRTTLTVSAGAAAAAGAESNRFEVVAELNL